MPALTPTGQARVAEIATRHGVSPGAAERLLDALARGGGTQAQFSEPELGGMGQWSRGGMIMIGDMFNNALKARVDALCTDLAGLLGSADLYEPPPAGTGASGWPAGLGTPSAAGAQNDMRYAVFPATRRLAVARGGAVTVYDTGDHRIGGVSQAQSGDQTLTFTSQLGPVRLTDLTVVSGDAPPAAAPAAPAAAPPPAPAAAPPGPAAAPTAPAASAAPTAGGDVLTTIERLAELRSRGVLTDEEFAAKKAELLARL